MLSDDAYYHGHSPIYSSHCVTESYNTHTGTSFERWEITACLCFRASYFPSWFWKFLGHAELLVGCAISYTRFL